MKDNKLIADFMEVRKITPSEKSGTTVLMFKLTGLGGWFREDELRYHKSWDWLMPVVEKIESIEDSTLPYVSYSQNNFCVSIGNGFCQIISGDFLMDFDEFDKHTGGKLEATYKAVVEFIKWYNENK